MVTRIGTGLASGMDIEAIIKAMLDIDRIPITEKQALQDTETIRYNAFSLLDTQITGLHSNTQKLDSYLTWRQKDVTSSNSSMMSATAEAKAYADSYSVNITTLATADRYKSNVMADKTNLGNTASTFKVNGVDVSVAANATLEDVMNAINDASMASMPTGKKVRASMIQSTLLLDSTSTGTDASMTIEDGSGDLLAKLGLLDKDAEDKLKNHTAATNLTGTMDGVAISSQFNTAISDVIQGVKMNFFETGTSTLTVSNDTATIKSLIKDFVASYNDSMDFMEQASSVNLNESTNKSEDGTVSSVGVLQGEYMLNDMKNKSRRIIMGSDSSLPVGFRSLANIGISTTGQENRLTIDEAALDDALQNNFDDVQNLMRNGPMSKYNDYLYSLIDPLEGDIDKAMTSSKTKYDTYAKEITDIETQLVDKETSLYNHFSKMETITSDLNSQLKYLLSSLGTTG